MVPRIFRVVAASLTLAVGPAAVACKREAPPPPQAAPDPRHGQFPAIDLEQNGVALHLTLPGWQFTGRDAESDVNVFEYGDRRLLIQLRRYRQTDASMLPEEAAGEALGAFCPKPPCKIGVIKPGYWLAHYDSEQDGALVLHWDLAAFPDPGIMALAMIKVTGVDDSAHRDFEKALKESLELTLAPKK